ncbi:hypothetical protein A6D6_01900 [Alcanivorax xiamenensis]|uniref:Nucleotidyltransferase n=1 Tax=Alcanivorax xiamenensis TaxID=1177156 RepID=A0ABQ6Y8X3_9GAMM|nr:nucleotidyltransferase domain-containing protein [Alcanivorax xiamenensis]KAF0806082.1 hypothetical protein A6D6_01900 [Alcanivorax xiamenensis]
MIDESVREEIMRRIRDAEQEHGVRVLYAVESGSRAWGFASPNSDYDVRFIYVHPHDWYLSVDLEDKRDVIEYEIVDDIDINGWDLRKALKLFWKSNPSFVEWMQSPIVYVDDHAFSEGVRSLMPGIYSVTKGVHHYHGMAKTNYKGYLKAQLVPLKKYFYVLRPLLAIRWLETHGEPAPIEFERLRETLADAPGVNDEISKLLERKKRSQEKEFVPAIPTLNRFIEKELSRLASYQEDPAERTEDLTALSQFFRSFLK